MRIQFGMNIHHEYNVEIEQGAVDGLTEAGISLYDGETVVRWLIKNGWVYPTDDANSVDWSDWDFTEAWVQDDDGWSL